MRRFNPGNFYCGTTAEWTSCPRPVRHPDHMSGSGSDYWYGESGVVRYSDHWGSEVASCDWYLDGVARCSFDDHDGWRCGFAPWTEFELKTFEVTVDRGRTGRLDGGLPRGSGLPVTPGHVRR